MMTKPAEMGPDPAVLTGREGCWRWKAMQAASSLLLCVSPPPQCPFQKEGQRYIGSTQRKGSLSSSLYPELTEDDGIKAADSMLGQYFWPIILLSQALLNLRASPEFVSSLEFPYIEGLKFTHTINTSFKWFVSSHLSWQWKNNVCKKMSKCSTL